MNTVTSLKTVKKNVRSLVEGALEEGGGLLRLAPCWVPRSFLEPGKRLKLYPDDLYAYGLNRGGIDERWFAARCCDGDLCCVRNGDKDRARAEARPQFFGNPDLRKCRRFKVGATRFKRILARRRNNSCSISRFRSVFLLPNDPLAKASRRFSILHQCEIGIAVGPWNNCDVTVAHPVFSAARSTGPIAAR